MHKQMLPEAVCCGLQTCNHCFVMRVIWCVRVPVYQLAPMFRQKQDIRHESPEKGGHSEK